MIRSILLSVFTFLVVMSTSAAEKPVSPMNVLFVGNSYTHMHRMPMIFERIAQTRGVKLNVEMSAKSSHTFKMHSERTDLFKKIKSKKWDYIVLQGFSRELSEQPAHIDTASIPYIGAILDSIYANHSCTNVLLYMTWGYKTGFDEREEINSNESMSDSVRVGYEYVSDLFGLPMVPVGPLWKEFRAKDESIELYEEDLQHPSFHGSYLIACSFYAAIFKSLPNSTFTGRIPKDEAKRLQTAAYNYVTNHLDTFKLTQNTLSVECERTHKGEYLVHCSANYPNARSVTWSFGDRSTSTKSETSHQYKKAGEYWVTLIIEDLCGTRKIKRKVKFVKPKKPSRNKKSKPKVVLDSTKKV